MKRSLIFGRNIFLVMILFFSISCNKNSVCDTCSRSIGYDLHPYAYAGTDIEILLPQTHVTLDGSSSTGPPSTPLLYSWSKISGPPYFAYDPLYTGVYSTNPKLEIDLFKSGEFLFQLSVSVNGFISKDTIKVLVNHSPTTAHPIDITFDKNSFCRLDGTFPSTWYYDESYFDFYARSDKSISGTPTFSETKIYQEYYNYGVHYFSQPSFVLNEGVAGKDSIFLNFSTSYNFFTLLAAPGNAAFSDDVTIKYGKGKFANILSGSSLNCTGTADIITQTGKLKLQGTIYY